MFSFLSNASEENSFIFYGSDTATWQAWSKPAGIKMVQFALIGGGGGGGRPPNNNSTGAGGGGAGAITTVLYNSFFLPNTIYVQPGNFGAGQTTANINGFNGEPSYVAVYPSTTAAFVLGRANAGSGGLAIGNGGIRGLAETNFNNMTLAAYSIHFSSSDMINGGAGGIALNGSVSQSTTVPITGGGGGAGATTGAALNGGASGYTSASAQDRFSGIPGGIGASTLGAPGNGGYTQFKPFFSAGGSGGGSAFLAGSGIGGNGGNGGYGAGGGGGASGITSGNGGNGGPGLVIIECW